MKKIDKDFLADIFFLSLIAIFTLFTFLVPIVGAILIGTGTIN